MIDFRYHVVSIVAVFLALAVGIIIGATSLRGEVAGTLNNQISELRKDKQDLRGQLDQSNLAGNRLDDYAEQVAPKALGGTLTGKRIALVLLPGTDDRTTDTTVSSLKTGGAVVTSSVALDEDWATRDQANLKATLTTAGKTLGLDTTTIPANRLAGQVLAGVLMPTNSAPGAQDTRATEARKVLSDADLIPEESTPVTTADAILVMWPDFTTDQAGSKAQIQRWTDLLTALAVPDRPILGASNGGATPSVTSDALISELRKSPVIAGAMSTVDDAGQAVGQAAVVLGLRDELAGRSGNYGLRRDATAIVPPETRVEGR